MNDKMWHQAVRDREMNICQGCHRFFDDNMLCGHHVKTKKAHPRLRHDINNGIAVCLKCHTFIHSRHLLIEGEPGNYKVRPRDS